MNISNNNFLSIEQLQDQYLKQQKVSKKQQSAQEVSFNEILQKQQIKNGKISVNEYKSEVLQNSVVKFSKHATSRLNDRNIELTEKQLERLNDGTKKAGEKGIKESLVLLDELAFIVNTKSNTVITAMDQTETTENIFTNIDGAVII